jgi:curli biogenesis system outer membrane secretion channel CsgG
MNKLIVVVAGILFSASTAFAQTPAAPTPAKDAAPAAAGCEAKAVGKNGKPLAGAAKKSFMKKCEAGSTDSKSAACMTKAVDKNGKALAGAAKNSFMKKCEAGAA